MERYIGKIREIMQPKLKPFEMDLSDDVIFSASMEGQKPEFVFKKGYQKVFDVANLAPRGTVFEYSPKNEWLADLSDPKKNRVTFGKFRGAKDIFNLLHEIAHLYDLEGNKKATELLMTLSDEIKKDKLNKYPDSRLAAMENFLEVRLEMEERAWRKALQFIRYIQKNIGGNIVEELGGEEKVQNFISKRLDGLRENHQSELEIQAGINSVYEQIH